MQKAGAGEVDGDLSLLCHIKDYIQIFPRDNGKQIKVWKLESTGTRSLQNTTVLAEEADRFMYNQLEFYHNSKQWVWRKVK